MGNQALGEDVYRKVVEEATDFAILLLDGEGSIVSWNSGAENIFGYVAEEVLGRPFDILFIDADRATGVPQRELDSARTLGRAEDARWHVGAGERWMFVDGVTTPILDDTGRATGFLKIARDVTDRHMTERRLAAQLALTNLLDHDQPLEVVARRILQTICDSLSWEIGGLWTASGGKLHCVEHWSVPTIDPDAVGDLCGGLALAPGEGLVGRVWETREARWLSDLSDTSKFARAPQAARAGMNAVFAFPLVTGGAIRGVMEFFSSAHRELSQPMLPTMTLIGGQIGDFLDRAETHRELRAALEQEQKARAEAESVRNQLERRAEEEAAFRHLASALTGAVEMIEVLHEITNRATHVTRADGVYVERLVTGPNGDKLVEVVASAGRGAPPRGLRVPFPGSMTDEILQGGAPVILADMNGFGRAMAPYLMDTCSACEVLVTPLSAERETLGALVLLNGAASGRHFRDGDIVRARTLGDLTSLALRRVRLLEQERAAKEKAEAAVRVRDETLGIVSHDLRNPLTKIALSVDLLDGATAEEASDLIETIRSSARLMQRLIADLLDVARLETGSLTVAHDELEPGPLVREMCDTNAAIAQQKGQRIVCHVDGDLPRICGDRDRLVQVFGNLIGNAMKFTPERGVITVAARRSESAIEFEVQDTGPGIPEGDLRHIFTPYWQAKKTAHMGAGLGLAIVRGIVEAHGGRVWAENGAGGGAVFRFTVPMMTTDSNR